MQFLRQLRILVWKNLALKTRNISVSILEVLIPIVVILVLIQQDGSTDPDKEDFFEMTIIISMPLCFLFASRFILSQVVIEKETKIKESLRIMSLKSMPYALSFIISQGVFNFMISLIVAMLFAIKHIIDFRDVPYFFFAVFLFSISIVNFALTLTTFFSESKLASQIGTLIIIMPMTIYLSMYNSAEEYLPVFYWLPHFPITVIIQNIAENSDGQLKHWGAWVALLGTIFFYFLLYLYLDAIIPDTYGINKPWNFCLKRRRRLQNQQTQTTEYVDLEGGQKTNREVFEQRTVENPIIIKDLSKTFGAINAVDKLCINIKSNEVFSLLGHNGAGKTTTLYMLTGILKPSSGDAQIYGHSISQELDEVRKNMGLCQQSDVLFEELTVLEHLQMVYDLKGIDLSSKEREINSILELVMLTDHKTKRTKQLSGGMKRKLSLGMALIGGSQIIILDEPTSGLDVHSRRQVWDLIRKIKCNRSIIMSTQHLEEADELGDRICIMSKGKVLTLDTAFNIKKHFGVGYNLILERKTEEEGERFARMKPEIQDVVLRSGLVQGAVESEDSSDKRLVYTLPFDQQQQIPKLLDQIEKQFAHDVYIDMEINSLEDCYMNIAKEEMKLQQSHSQIDVDNDPADPQSTVTFDQVFLDGAHPTTAVQTVAVFVRRLQQFKRDRRVWVVFLAPFIASLFSFLIIKTISFDTEEMDQEIHIVLQGIVFAAGLIIGYANTAGLFIIGPVYERQMKLRYLMNCAGLRSTAQVLGNFAADILLYMIPTTCMVVVLKFMEIEALGDKEGFVMLVLIFFGFALISFTYVFSHIFKDANRAYRLYPTLNLCVQFLLPIGVTALLSVIGSKGFSIIINTVFYLIPFCPLYQSLMFICVETYYGTDSKDFDYDTYFPGFIPEHSIVCSALIIQGIVYLILAIWIDKRKNQAFRNPDGRANPDFQVTAIEPDEEVVEEQKHIKGIQENNQDYNLVVKNLTKCYSNGQQAVNDISFGIKKRNVIGLLGPNGAGKSTTFNILSMDISPSNGDISLLNTNLYDFKTQEAGKGNRMGLCPQFNTIWDKLTVDEHLNFMGLVKGLNRTSLQSQRSFLKRELDLQEFSDRKAETLSGGNKRKLCCAMSLLANPLVEFLDEPTSGMDPVARRNLFNILKLLKNSSILLTTHRMDEAEALCDNIAIMINGTFVCYGSPGHLKAKFGEGYQMVLHLPSNSISEGELDEMVSKMLPWSVKDDRIHQDEQSSEDETVTEVKQIAYHLTKTSGSEEFKLSKVFATLNQLVLDGVLSDYSVTRSSLEHVFIRFAKHQSLEHPVLSKKKIKRKNMKSRK